MRDGPTDRRARRPVWPVVLPVLVLLLAPPAPALDRSTPLTPTGPLVGQAGSAPALPAAPASAPSAPGASSPLGGVLNLSVGSGPIALAANTSSGELYVANYDSGNVSLIAGDSLNGSVGAGLGPIGVTYDPGNGDVYVANFDGASVTVLKGGKAVGTAHVGSYPFSATYDPANGYVYVTDAGSDQVSILSGSNVTATVPVGSQPGVGVYDGRNGFVYLVNFASNNVSVLNGTAVEGAVDVGRGPSGIEYVNATGLVYVENYDNASVTVLNGSSARVNGPSAVLGTVPVGAAPFAGVYDAADGDLYVTDQGSAQVTLIQNTSNVATVPVGSSPSAAASDPLNGNVYVGNEESGNVSVLSGASVLGSLTVGADPYDVAYDPGTGTIAVADFGANNVTLITPPPPPSYAVNFTETGLPAGTTWSVSFPVPGRGTDGGPSDLPWLLVPGVPPGRYAFQVGAVPGFQAMPDAGSFTVANGSVSVPIAFGAVSAPRYAVTFVESGLSNGVSWGVTFNGTGRATTPDPLVFTGIVNGSQLTYEVLNVPGYYATPSEGELTVDRPLSQPIVFLPVPPSSYDVNFTASGLPARTNWSVTLGGTEQISANGSLTFLETNGTYDFTVGAPPGYRATPASGQVGVAGRADATPLVFTLLAQPGGPMRPAPAEAILGENAATLAYVVAGAITAIAVGVALGLWWRRGPRLPPRSP